MTQYPPTHNRYPIPAQTRRKAVLFVKDNHLFPNMRILPKILLLKNYCDLTEYLPDIRHDGGMMIFIPLF